MLEEQTIADKLTCRDCQELADGVSHYKVIKSFTTTDPANPTRPVIWRPPLVCRVITKAVAGELRGEWAYTTHAVLEHPEARGAYMALCAVRVKVEAR